MKYGKITNYSANTITTTNKGNGKENKLFISADVEITFDKFRLIFRTDNQFPDHNKLNEEAVVILKHHFSE